MRALEEFLHQYFPPFGDLEPEAQELFLALLTEWNGTLEDLVFVAQAL